MERFNQLWSDIYAGLADKLESVPPVFVCPRQSATGIAQPGSAEVSGTSGRRFKSPAPANLLVEEAGLIGIGFRRIVGPLLR